MTTKHTLIIYSDSLNRYTTFTYRTPFKCDQSTAIDLARLDGIPFDADLTKKAKYYRDMESLIAANK